MSMERNKRLKINKSKCLRTALLKNFLAELCYALYDKDQFHPKILPQELLIRPSFLSSAGQKSRAFSDSSVFIANTAREHICPTTTWTAKTTWMFKEPLWLKEPYIKTMAGALGTKPPSPICSRCQQLAKHCPATVSFHKEAALTEVVFWRARKEHNSATLIQENFQHRWVPDFRRWNSVWFPSAAALI